MSWQAYIDTSLIGSGNIDKAAIISAAGDSIWAHSPGFEPSAEEMKKIVGLLGGSDAAVSSAYAEGFFVCKDRYVATRVEPEMIQGRSGKLGIAIVKTKQAILVGHYGESVLAGNATQTVASLGDYLTGLGY